MPKIKKDPAAPAAEKITVSMKDYEVEEEESLEKEEETFGNGEAKADDDE